MGSMLTLLYSLILVEMIAAGGVLQAHRRPLPEPWSEGRAMADCTSGGRPRLTKTERLWIVTQYKAGKGETAIAQELGVARGTIHRWLTHFGVRKRSASEARKRFTDEELRQHVSDRYYRQRDERLVKVKAYRDGLRMEFLAAYGGVCFCCGESNPRFLTLEHKRGNGAHHRRLVHHTDAILRQLRNEGWPQADYGLLCYNCNLARGFYGYCPHEKQKQIVAPAFTLRSAGGAKHVVCRLCEESRNDTPFFKFCAGCQLWKPRAVAFSFHTTSHKWQSPCKSCRSQRRDKSRLSEYQNARRIRLRLAVIAGYGGCCQCCGESTYEFLVIDHKNNDGKADRGGGVAALHQRLIMEHFPQDRYQLLCHNCNCARQHNGVCPHTESRGQ